MMKPRALSRLTRLVLPLTLLMLPAVVASCADDAERTYIPNVTDPSKTPTMSTTKVSTFISDSGYTKYHITTDVWNIYDELPDPLWIFPTGVDLVNFDQNMRPAATLRCDSATYYSNRRLWRLDGHVVMVNALRDTFLTQQLFWDQNKAQVYSDSFIHITKSKHIIEGYGFTSNQTMTAYDVNRPTAIIPVERGNSASGAGPLTPTPMPGVIDPDDATRAPGSRMAAPEPASVRNARRQQAVENPPTQVENLPPAATPRRSGSVTAPR